MLENASTADAVDWRGGSRCFRHVAEQSVGFLNQCQVPQAGSGKSFGLPMLSQFQQNATKQECLLVVIPNRRELDNGGAERRYSIEIDCRTFNMRPFAPRMRLESRVLKAALRFPFSWLSYPRSSMTLLHVSRRSPRVGWHSGPQEGEPRHQVQARSS